MSALWAGVALGGHQAVKDHSQHLTAHGTACVAGQPLPRFGQFRKQPGEDRCRGVAGAFHYGV